MNADKLLEKARKSQGKDTGDRMLEGAKNILRDEAVAGDPTKPGPLAKALDDKEAK